MEYKYDVALSFSGNEREYVEKVAGILKQNGIRVFYDKFEEVDLWGKDLGVNFDYVYRRESKYFIPFISKSYKESIWTHHEVRTAIARAIENKEEYILPVRFDDTEIDGIRSTIGHLNIKDKSPNDLAEIILQKLGSEPNIPIPEKEEPKDDIYLTTYLQVSDFGAVGILIGVTVTNTIKEHRYFNTPYFRISKPVEGNNDTFQLLNPMPNISFPYKMEYGQQFTVQYRLTKYFLDSLESVKGEGVTLKAFCGTTVGERFTSNSMNIDDTLKYRK